MTDTYVYNQFPFKSFVPYYANGLGITYTSVSAFAISTGSILDSAGETQIVSSAVINVASTSSGLNGLDTGTIAASTVYSVYLVADPVTLQTTGAVISLSTTTPLLPFSYSAFAKIGYITTDASSHFLPGLWTSTDSSRRTFMYDAPQATAVTAGASTTYANVNLIALVPNLSKGLVYINTAFTPGAASRVLNLQPAGNTGDEVAVTGQVTSVPVTTTSYLFQRQATISMVISPAIAYKVSNAGDAVAVNVQGYDFFI